jgi:ArsR family transcriptional regulator, lead/cadmium/zinc/bismuth-responsive transcriptional repressor
MLTNRHEERDSVVMNTSTGLPEDVCQERCIHPEHALAVRRHLLTVELARSVADLFAVLSDPTRLQVVFALLHATTGELCVCDLAAGLGRDDTTISHQLRVLRAHHIVTMRKVGRVVYYCLVDEHIRHLLAIGLKHASVPLPAVLQAHGTEALA